MKRVARLREWLHIKIEELQLLVMHIRAFVVAYRATYNRGTKNGGREGGNTRTAIHFEHPEDLDPEKFADTIANKTLEAINADKKR